jgi:hypothetical protein
MSQDPNATQVGGSHYQSAYQHWDLVADNQLPYFPAQITRYTTRWMKKNGAQDIDKAIHYTEKLIALHTETAIPVTGYYETAKLALPEARAAKGVSRFIKENGLGDLEHLVFQILFTYTTLVELEHVHDILHKLLCQAENAEEIVTI